MDDLTLSPVFQALVKEYSGQRCDVKDHVKWLLKSSGLIQDANESIMFARELEYVYAKTFDVIYPACKARSIIPVNREVPTGADTHTYQQFDRRGEAKEIDDYAQDFPTVEVSGAELSAKIVSLGDAYHYSTQDMRNAAMAKKPLDAMKASAARLAMEEKLEKIAALGSSARGIKGLLNAANVTDVASLPHGQWDSLDPATDTTAIQVDVAYLINKMWVDSKTAHGNSGLTLLCDTTTYAMLKTRPQSATFKDSSVADFLMRTCPQLSSIEYWLQNDTGKDGVRQLCLYEKTPDVCELIIPQEFEQLPPQLVGMAFKIFCHMRTGGVAVRRPLAMLYTDDHIG